MYSGLRVFCRVLLLIYFFRMESKNLLGYPLSMKVYLILFMVVSNKKTVGGDFIGEKYLENLKGETI